MKVVKLNLLNARRLKLVKNNIPKEEANWFVKELIKIDVKEKLKNRRKR